MEHTKESIQKLLDTDPRAVERALVVLFGRQTQDEKRDRDAKWQNTVGFDAFRAPTCTKYARWIEAGLREGCRLGQCIKSPTERDKARQFVRRYWRQLVEAAQAKQAAEDRAAAEYECLEREAIQQGA